MNAWSASPIRATPLRQPRQARPRRRFSKPSVRHRRDAIIATDVASALIVVRYQYYHLAGGDIFIHLRRLRHHGLRPRLAMGAKVGVPKSPWSVHRRRFFRMNCHELTRSKTTVPGGRRGLQQPFALGMVLHCRRYLRQTYSRPLSTAARFREACRASDWRARAPLQPREFEGGAAPRLSFEKTFLSTAPSIRTPWCTRWPRRQTTPNFCWIKGGRRNEIFGSGTPSRCWWTTPRRPLDLCPRLFSRKGDSSRASPWGTTDDHPPSRALPSRWGGTTR